MPSKTILYTLIFFILSIRANAQLLENKINIYFGYTTGKMCGDGLAEEIDFPFPSFFGNFNNFEGASIKGIVNIQKYLSVGLEIESNRATNWSFLELNEYEGSELKLFSISPILNIHSKSKNEGVFNRIKLFVELGGEFGKSNLILSKSLSEFQFDHIIFLEETKSGESFFYGIQGAIGVCYRVTDRLGTYLNYKFSQNWIQSNLYFDRDFSYSSATIGVFIGLLRDKTFFY